MISLKRRLYSEDFDLYNNNELIQTKALIRRNAYLYGDRSFDKLDFGKLIRKPWSEDYILADGLAELIRLPFSENYKFVLNPLPNPITTFNRGDFTATNAFFWSSLDLSALAGTDLGYTPFYVEALDAAGKKATGYLAGVGAGETLGSELVDSWVNSAVHPYETFTTTGSQIDSAINTTGRAYVYKVVNFVSGWLVKLVQNLTLNSGTAPKYYAGSSEGFDPPNVNFTMATGNDIIYRTAGAAYTHTGYLNGLDEATNFSMTGFSLKQVTDPPATAVHIVSSLNGTTRDWASIESGFDPNTIASGKIYNSIMGNLYSWDFTT